MYVAKQRTSRSKRTAKKPIPDKIGSPLAAPKLVTASVTKGSSEMEARLDKLESMMHLLFEKLTPAVVSGQVSDEGSNSELSSYKTELEPESDSAPSQPEFDDMYFGPLTTFSLFSSKGLKWLTSQLPDATPMTVLRQYLHELQISHTKTKPPWRHPPGTLEWDLFPPQEVITVMLHDIRPFFGDSSPLEMNLVHRLFQKYFNYKKGLIPESALSQPEIFLLSCVMLVAASLVSELVRTINIKCSLSLSELQDLGQKLNDSCLHQTLAVSMLPPNLLILQGVCLMVIMFDMNMISHATGNLTSILVRCAQEMGLHREETYTRLSESARQQRIALWWSCYILDREQCMKCGNPPAINDMDVTTPPLPGFEDVWALPNERMPDGSHKREHYTDKIRTRLTNLLEKDCADANFDVYLAYDLSCIISRTYKELFSATALTGKTRGQVEATIRSLLHDLECWRMCFPVQIRPGQERNYIQEFQNFREVKSPTEGLCLPFVALNYNLKYYLLQIVISKTMLRLNWFSDSKHTHLSSNRDNQHVNLERIGLNAIRQSLRSAYQLDRSVHTYVQFATFYFLCAYVALVAEILQNPSSPEVVEDVKLLFRVSKDYFHEHEESHHPMPTPEKWEFMDKITRCLFYIVWSSVPNIDVKCNLDIGDHIEEFTQMEMEIRRKKGTTSNTNSISSLYGPPTPSSRLPFDKPSVTQSTSFQSPNKEVYGELLNSVVNTPYTSDDQIFDGFQSDATMLQNMFSLPNYLFDVSQNNYFSNSPINQPEI
ncbi:hypothetical protein OGAPHI_002556 [Ogataea philodendri]|uniref:Xylanolytic transcriptional activator regulatory domain-containing protein n=1 Tax=Ogataea philodendri TaxID=1378263 RepID=A0A9P8PBM9_9ASCO|nr:uncharacterized protein OGAPHI_002556 [Ogataea philodendri]KAH3668801.1 hypothetical protein OGAPHI_002556 [Ogataea philodendri]